MDFYTLFNEYKAKIKEFNKKKRTESFYFVEKNVFFSLCFESLGLFVVFTFLSMIKFNTFFIGLLTCFIFFFVFLVIAIRDKNFINNSKEFRKKKTLKRYEMLENLLKEKKVTLKKEILDVLINMATYNKENLKTNPSKRLTNIFDTVLGGIITYITQEFIRFAGLEGLQTIVILIVEFLTFTHFIIPEIKNIFRKEEHLYNEFIYDLQSIYLSKCIKKTKQE